jgi:putative acetyltransferase
MSIRQAREADRDTLLGVWLRSVQKSHRFLTEADIAALTPGVRDRALVELELWVLEVDGKPAGFLGMMGNKMEALFIAPEFWRRGGGRLLVEHARARHRRLLVDVNDQNPEARQFYEAMGFVVIGRSEVDDQGRPFPLLHMQEQVERS